MRSLTLTALMMAGLMNRTPLPEVVRIERKHNPGRLSKAEKKRARKAAQRLKLTQVKLP